MSDTQADCAGRRFRAFWAGILALLSFGCVMWLALGIGTRPSDRLTQAATEVIAARQQNLQEVRAAQAALVDPAKLKASVQSTIAALASKKGAPTQFVVPGSPTFMKQLQEAAAAPQPAPAPAPETKPAPAPAPAPQK
ncbi:MAG: hypothetical protein KDM91_01925 [Verrucomicrobiae bacterium]|nr:hypothetical protein [Verrucomicrobiae bacterium]MCP5540117.1 hypothetical protein [Akkermansiaceae bacterium]